MRKRIVAVVVLGAGLAVAGAAPAFAAHTHYIVTPEGCHQVAEGQTSISDPELGGYHQFHMHVHLGATEGTDAPDNLGDGNAVVQVFKDACPA